MARVARRWRVGGGQAASRQSSRLSVLGVTLPTILACTLNYKFSAHEVNQIIETSGG
jgi:hypothetical protein